MVKKIEIRIATAADLKSDRFTLNVGQPYLVSPDGGDTVTGIYVLQGDEDVFILKKYLETGRLFVPLKDHCFMNFIKDNSNELLQD